MIYTVFTQKNSEKHDSDKKSVESFEINQTDGTAPLEKRNNSTYLQQYEVPNNISYQFDQVYINNSGDLAKENNNLSRTQSMQISHRIKLNDLIPQKTLKLPKALDD